MLEVYLILIFGKYTFRVSNCLLHQEQIGVENAKTIIEILIYKKQTLTLEMSHIGEGLCRVSFELAIQVLSKYGANLQAL